MSEHWESKSAFEIRDQNEDISLTGAWLLAKGHVDDPDEVSPGFDTPVRDRTGGAADLDPDHIAQRNKRFRERGFPESAFLDEDFVRGASRRRQQRKQRQRNATRHTGTETDDGGGHSGSSSGSVPDKISPSRAPDNDSRRFRTMMILAVIGLGVTAYGVYKR